MANTYSTGTLEVVTGQKLARLTGGLATNFNMKSGDLIKVADGSLNAIESTNTTVTPHEITLAVPYDGANHIAATYFVTHMPAGWADIIALNEHVADEIRAIGTGIVAQETLEQFLADAEAVVEQVETALEQAADIAAQVAVAVAAKDDAIVAKDDAIEAAGNALSYQAGAEAAQVAAVTAQGAAITARTGAEDARDTAVTASTDAETAQEGAEAAETKAEAWASAPEDVEVETDKFSALHYATKAMDAVSEIETDRAAAEAAAGASAGSAAAAALSETNAASHEADVLAAKEAAEDARDAAIEAASSISFGVTPVASAFLRQNAAADSFEYRTPSQVKSDIGLGNANDTSDANKPVSTAQQTALDLKANSASPTLTGTPLAPTPAVGTNTNQIATAAFVRNEVAALIGAAPETLDTLEEIAAKLEDGDDVVAALTTLIGTKANEADYDQVDNTSDLAKPISTETAFALARRPAYAGMLGSSDVNFNIMDAQTIWGITAANASTALNCPATAAGILETVSNNLGGPSALRIQRFTANFAGGARVFMRAGSAGWGAWVEMVTEATLTARFGSLKMWTGDAAAYAAITTKDANTLYFVS